MKEGFSWEELSPSLSICVSSAHKFGTDAFLLSDFASPRRKDLCCDLGTGCGIIPLLWFRDEPPRLCYGVDIQKQAVMQLEQSVQKNGLEGRLFPLRADLKELSSLPCGPLDLVTCNPPYKANDAGIVSPDMAKRIARHEVACEFSDICAAAAKLLQYHGRFCVCCRPERLTDVMYAMRAHGIEPKRLRHVCKNPESAPWLFLLEGMKGAKSFLQIEPSLYMRSGTGMTAEAAQICHFGEAYL